MPRQADAVPLPGFLATRGQPGDADQALAHFTRSLELAEQLRTQNPTSAEAARDVSVSLDGLGDFLATRGQPGDADQALAYFTRCHEVLEQLLAQNPTSAQAARDVMVSIERMAQMYASQDKAAEALAEQERALVIARQLWDNNHSYERGRTLAISSLLTGQYAQAAKDQDKAITHLRECFTILDAFVSQGSQLDAPMRGLHAKLKPQFATP